VAHARCAGICRPAVRLGSRLRGEVGPDEGVQAVGGEVVDPSKTNAAWPRVHDLDGAGQERRSVVAVPLSSANGALFGLLIDRGFVDFHQTEQEVAVGIGRTFSAMSRLSNHGKIQ